MKFIHTADVHLGAQFKNLGEKGKEAREGIKKAFSRAVDSALNEKADFFFIAGDLFESNNPGQSLVDFAKKELARLAGAGVRVLIAVGNHDAASADSVYFREDFLSATDGKISTNIFVFSDRKNLKKEFPEFNLAVHSSFCGAYESGENPFAGAAAEPGKFNIALIHGSSSKTKGEDYKKYYPFEPSDVSKSKMNYVALGHYHSFRDESSGNVPAFYPGSPEPLSIAQKGAGSVIVGEMDEKTGKVSVKQIAVSQNEFDEKNVILDDISGISELKEKILEGAKKNLTREVVLSGFSNPTMFIEAGELEEELGENFFRLRIINKSRSRLEAKDLEAFPKETIMGKFITLAAEKIKNAKSPEEAVIFEEALQIGVAELSGQDAVKAIIQ